MGTPHQKRLLTWAVFWWLPWKRLCPCCGPWGPSGRFWVGALCLLQGIISCCQNKRALKAPWKWWILPHFCLAFLCLFCSWGAFWECCACFPSKILPDNDQTNGRWETGSWSWSSIFRMVSLTITTYQLSYVGLKPSGVCLQLWLQGAILSLLRWVGVYLKCWG